MSGGSWIGEAPRPTGGRRFSRMYVIRTISSRQARFGSTSGGGTAWHGPQAARTGVSSGAWRAIASGVSPHSTAVNTNAKRRILTSVPR